MNYEDFLARVRDDLEKRLSASFEGVRVEVARTEKLQNQSYTGIRIGLPDLDVSPMINPTNLFEEVNRGRTFDSVVDELADMAGDALATADTLKENSFTERLLHTLHWPLCLPDGPSGRFLYTGCLFRQPFLMEVKR